MWKLTLVLNAILMAILGLASAVSQVALESATLQYSASRVKLPAPGQLALQVQWLYTAVPLLWTIFTIILLVLNWKRTEPSRDMVQLHTSATLLIGIVMLVFFSTAALMPFFALHEGWVNSK